MSAPNENESSIESLEKRLYKRDGDVSVPLRHVLSHSPDSAERSWKPHALPQVSLSVFEETMPFSKKVLIGSIIFFAFAVIVGGLLFLGGRNVFSPDNIDLSVSGPVSVEGGQELSLQIIMTNRNEASLEGAELSVTYPEGTKAADEPSKDLPRFREYLGTVPPGQVVNKTVRAILYGEERSMKDIVVSVEYRAPGSNAIFQKEKRYQISVSSSPVSIAVQLPKEVNARQEITLSARVGANTSDPAKNVLVEVSYPPGFSFRGAVPPPQYRNNVWLFPSLAPGKTHDIEIRGVLEGQNEEAKTFKVSAGLAGAKDEQKIATIYNAITETLVIRKPYVGAELFLNGNQSDPLVVGSDEVVRGDIAWINNLPDPVYDAEVTLRFSGQALDKASVTTGEGGFYQSLDNVILWDKGGVAEFGTLEPGSSGRLSFSFSALPLFSEGAPRLRNPEIGIEVTIRGNRASSGSQRDPLETMVTKKVRISTAPQLASRAVYSVGPFTNSGPVPPKAELQTTYTIVWSVSNSSSDMSDTVVEASLPPYVKWLGAFVPQTEKVEYDPVGGKVRWLVGTLKAGTGVTSSAREVSFQVAFSPSVSQVQTVPVLLSDAVLTGSDDFTGAVVKSVRKALTTKLASDPVYGDMSGAVVAHE